MMDLGYIRSAGWLLLARDLFPLLLSIVYRWMHVFVSIVIDVTEYDSDRNPEGCILVAKTITERATLKWGKRILHDKLGFAIHDTMIGKWFWATTDISRRGYSEEGMSITVYTFRWHKPIVSDDDATRKLPVGKMWEAVNTSMRLDGQGFPNRQRDPVDLDTRKCPESVKTTALQVVKIIEEECECGSILIQGPPGVGKTYTARLFNSMSKNAVLCPDFNPLKGETPNSVYGDLGCRRDKLILVLVINEVEEVIKKMGSKTEWNNMLDLVNNSPHMFKLIMTTNVPLERLIKKDIALLRDGRVAKLELEVQDDMGVRVNMVGDADLMARSTPDEPDEPDEPCEATKPLSRRRAFAKLIRAGFHRSR